MVVKSINITQKGKNIYMPIEIFKKIVDGWITSHNLDKSLEHNKMIFELYKDTFDEVKDVYKNLNYNNK